MEPIQLQLMPGAGVKCNVSQNEASFWVLFWGAELILGTAKGHCGAVGFSPQNRSP